MIRVSKHCVRKYLSQYQAIDCFCLTAFHKTQTHYRQTIAIVPTFSKYYGWAAFCPMSWRQQGQQVCPKIRSYLHEEDNCVLGLTDCFCFSALPPIDLNVSETPFDSQRKKHNVHVSWKNHRNISLPQYHWIKIEKLTTSMSPKTMALERFDGVSLSRAYLASLTINPSL